MTATGHRLSALLSSAQARHECVARDLGTEADRQVEATSQECEEALAVDAQEVGRGRHGQRRGSSLLQLRGPAAAL
jgi:hypothetical protein